ncbi:MAG: flavodoxin domain-containing protein [bacterium]|nr:flavodoxin domain-containing protein [bacterium]MCS7309620.1 flavodoxin domain-containing protein [Armatimonadota bacterium]MDW8104214.1 flavodoxin domain-containing protein [Armatimonadota bacterium]
MGKVLVLYDTASGNTRKMAELVARGAESVPNTEVRLKSVEEATADDLLWCDGIAVGTPTNMGTISWRMKRWWDEVAGPVWNQVDGKIGCAFSSSGGWGGGAELACMTVLTILMNFGFLVFGVTDYVGKQFTLHYGAVLAGEPRSENEIASCQRLGQRLAQWVAVYMDGNRSAHPLQREGSS